MKIEANKFQVTFTTESAGELYKIGRLAEKAGLHASEIPSELDPQQRELRMDHEKLLDLLLQ